MILLTGDNISSSNRSKLGILYGIGVGPGDPQLITLKALSLLKQVDYVFAPAVNIDTPGRAEAIVKSADRSIKIERLKMSIDENALESYKQNSITIAQLLKNNHDVAIITLGDPNLYSSFNSYQTCLQEMLPGLDIISIPGIMAFQDLAARANTMLADNDDQVYLISCINEIDGAIELLKDTSTTLIIYKGGKFISQIKEALISSDRIEDAIIGNRLGLEDECFMKLADFEPESASYLATVIIPSKRP